MKDITCFNIRKNYYQVDIYGNIYVKTTKRKRKTAKNSCGYNIVKLVCSDNVARYFMVHRVVLQTYNPIPDPENYEVNHIKGKVYGDGLDNLTWATSSENIKHAYETGLMKALKGENSPVSNFTNDFVHLLCGIMETKYTYDDISSELKKHGHLIIILGNFETRLRRLIDVIRQRTAWVDISSQYNIIRNPKKEYGTFESYEKIDLVCKMIQHGYSNDYICKCIFGEKTPSRMCLIRSIRNNRTYRYISNKYW